MVEQHPIQGLMTTAMQSIKEMVDVNTIVGDAVQSPDGTVIIPISRVSFGFAAGGGEYSNVYNVDKRDSSSGAGSDESVTSKFPFAGGSGAGVSINPVAFMVVGQGQIKLLPVNVNSSFERMMDIIPGIVEKADKYFKSRIGRDCDEKIHSGRDCDKKIHSGGNCDEKIHLGRNCDERLEKRKDEKVVSENKSGKYNGGKYLD